MKCAYVFFIVGLLLSSVHTAMLGKKTVADLSRSLRTIEHGLVRKTPDHAAESIITIDSEKLGTELFSTDRGDTMSMHAIQSTAYHLVNDAGKKVTLIIKMGDMLAQDVDVVVDAANADLVPGTGVSGALKYAFLRFASKNNTGQTLKNWRNLCVKHDGKRLGKKEKVSAGEAVFNLGVRCLSNDTKKDYALINAVGPSGETTDKVAGSYARALELANNAENFYQQYAHELRSIGNGTLVPNKQVISSIAMPLLSIGVFGHPVPDVTYYAIREIVNFLATAKNVTTVYLMCWNSKKNYKIVMSAMQAWVDGGNNGLDDWFKKNKKIKK